MCKPTKLIESHFSTADENTEDTSVYSAVYSSISLVNGKINRMDLSQLKALCKQNKLSPNGKESAIRHVWSHLNSAGCLIRHFGSILGFH